MQWDHTSRIECASDRIVNQPGASLGTMEATGNG